ncbi:MAG: hypothetical protein RL131_15 [Bacteroidota bacterium]
MSNRHDHLRDTFVHFLRAASIVSQKEVVGVLGGKDRVGDFVLPFADNNNPVYFDVTVRAPLIDRQRIRNTIAEPNRVAEQGVQDKLKARKATDEGYIETPSGPAKFVPLGFSALGGYSANASNFVTMVSKEWSLRSTLHYSVCANNMHNKISFALWRSNSISLMNGLNSLLKQDLELCGPIYRNKWGEINPDDDLNLCELAEDVDLPP